MKTNITFFCFFLLFNLLLSQQKENKYTLATVAFYNVENLFDTLSSVDVYNKKTQSHKSISFEESVKSGINFLDNNYVKDKSEENLYVKLINNEEFTPKGTRNWTQKKYKKKIENISYVLANIGNNLTKSAPVIIGLSEIENEHVLKDLVVHPYISHYNYKIIHHNSFDSRGIDCALMYQSNRFKVIKQKVYKLELDKNNKKEYTRDILLVSGLLDGEQMSFLVNHWPSRRGGEKFSEPNRIKAATLLKSIIEEVQKESPNGKIIVMGDFNDIPSNKSIRKILSGVDSKEKTTNKHLFNPMENLSNKGFGTTAFKDNWFLFDQILVSNELINDKELNTYQYYKSGIFDEPYLKTTNGKYKGYPKRSFEGDVFNYDGYSDHLPVYIYLYRKYKN